jgi:hypothetical protein
MVNDNRRPIQDIVTECLTDGIRNSVVNIEKSPDLASYDPESFGNYVPILVISSSPDASTFMNSFFPILKKEGYVPHDFLGDGILSFYVEGPL